ncbi:hypothetical protein D7322_27350 [Sphingobacterium puteale]|uniref:Uncharacterized protein n=1 Tax=Sphingobacterium puteale TaxID=2420510 RepID=A0A420VQ60_9SPHI|nr:hypothetical protein [Sphingobacterium puteale]RKO68397.1 hypothetical protein D7322_27350 [Sphingobacterium puteale]
MGFFDSLFGKKIVFTPEMKIMAESLIENDWFRNCGQQSDYDTKFNVEIAHGISEVEKKLAYKRDVKGFVTLDNLLIEAGRRSQLFLSLHHKNEMQYTWNRLTDVIIKEYISNQKFDFDKIQNNFNTLLGTQTDLYLRGVFINILKEIYFNSFIEGYPTFLSEVVDVYLKGNVIVGWIGKFGSHEVQVNEISAISVNDGVVNIW